MCLISTLITYHNFNKLGCGNLTPSRPSLIVKLQNTEYIQQEKKRTKKQENDSAGLQFTYYFKTQPITKSRKFANICGQFICESINNSLTIGPIYFG
jgi:hypothetical protein